MTGLHFETGSRKGNERLHALAGSMIYKANLLGVSNKPALASKRADSIAIGKLSNINVTRLVVEKVQPGAFFAYFLSREKKRSSFIPINKIK
jgi:hypothetical protein